MPSAHIHWRLYITAAGTGGYGSLVELEFLDAELQRCPLDGGTPLSSSDYGSGYDASKAFDGVIGGDVCWAPSSQILPSWLGYRHAEAVEVSAVRLTARSTAPQQAPTEFQLQYSDDGADWRAALSTLTPLPAWSASEQRLFFIHPVVSAVLLEDFAVSGPPRSRGQALENRVGAATAIPILPTGGAGYLAGTHPNGITSVEGVPTSATVRVLYRPASGALADGAVVAEVRSAPDGTWRVDGLNPDYRYDVVGRLADYNDVIASEVQPLDAA